MDVHIYMCIEGEKPCNKRNARKGGCEGRRDRRDGEQVPGGCEEWEMGE